MRWSRGIQISECRRRLVDWLYTTARVRVLARRASYGGRKGRAARSLLLEMVRWEDLTTREGLTAREVATLSDIDREMWRRDRRGPIA